MLFWSEVYLLSRSRELCVLFIVMVGFYFQPADRIYETVVDTSEGCVPFT